MYKEFFGLRANPFNVNPDPRYLFLTRHTEEALACLTYGIQSRKGFVLLTGEVGTGKTTLLRHLGGWWHTTGFAQRVFYFGYDTRAWTLQQIMMEIAQQLYGPTYYTNFQPLSPHPITFVRPRLRRRVTALDPQLQQAHRHHRAGIGPDREGGRARPGVAR